MKSPLKFGSDHPRQVQDLERQLQEARQQLERYRASENYHDEQNSPSGLVGLDPFLEIRDLGRPPRRMLKSRSPQDLSTAHAHFSNAGKGLLSPPIAPLTLSDERSGKLSLLSLPREDVAQHCLDIYLECVHRRLPILQWPEFCGRFWSLYSPPSNAGVPTETLSLVFAVLALGALFSPDSGTRNSAEKFASTAFSYINLWADNVGLDRVLASFLVSTYLYEINQRLTSWTWLGSTIQFAQDKGLHLSGGQWSRAETEHRRRTWYCLYVSERFVILRFIKKMR